MEKRYLILAAVAGLVLLYLWRRRTTGSSLSRFDSAFGVAPPVPRFDSGVMQPAPPPPPVAGPASEARSGRGHF